MDFSETIVVYYIKVVKWSQLNEYMKLYEDQRSRSFIDLVPNHLGSIFLNFFSSITADYTPGIYAEGYIVFVFPFVRSYVHSFVLPTRS